MLDAILTLIIIVTFSLFVFFFIGKKGYWGEVEKKYSRKIKKIDLDDLKWTPLATRDLYKNETFYISIASVQIVEDTIYISYVFPFCFMLPMIMIRRDDIVEYNVVGYGFMSKREVVLKNISYGVVIFPRSMSKELDGFMRLGDIN